VPSEFDPKKPRVAGLSPVHVKLEKGAYFWCACGHSQKQPFCDGSHTGYDIRPVRFVAAEPIDVPLCMCKHTRQPPFCDGTHKYCQEAGVQPGEQVPDGVLKITPLKNDAPGGGSGTK
jgi:CDGSH-type Zn-finger protein